MRKLEIFAVQNENNSKSIANPESYNLEDVAFNLKYEDLIITVKQKNNTITETILRYDRESGKFYNVDK